MKTFDELYRELHVRSVDRPDGSRTAELLEAGVHAIGKKVIEEAAEVWMAAEHETDEELSVEIAQLIYHLQVLMVAKGLTPQDVYRSL